MRIMQGDSYPIYIELKQDGNTLTPEMVEEMEVCVGEGLTKLLSDGGVMFDKEIGKWYIHPSQEETLALSVMETHEVIVRIRYKGSDPAEVVGLKVGRIAVNDSISEEVI